MNKADDELMRLALQQAAQCKPAREEEPRVGAVLARNGQLVDQVYREETGPGDHAEFALLNKKIRSSDLVVGATLYTTLEPCTTRSHDKLPCAEWIVKKKVRRVVIGMLDPNPNICGRGYWHLLDGGVDVDFCSHEVTKDIVAANAKFIALHRGSPQISASLAWMIARNKGRAIASYPSMGWGDQLSLQDCPNFREGWPMAQVELRHDDGKPFVLPDVYKGPYETYRQQFYDQKRFKDDNEKFMLEVNPIAFLDSTSLILRTRSTRYSEVQFYRDNISIVAALRDPLIEDLVRGSLRAEFAHAFCMHMIVVTSDHKLLLTKRSPKVAFYPRSWSCGVEEQLHRDDIIEGPEHTVQKWGERLLGEELGLSDNHFAPDNLKVLSVFLEADCLNISLCGYVELRIDSNTLDAIIKGHPRGDYEFTEWQFLPLEKGTLLSELLQPTRYNHPSSCYRFLMTTLKYHGFPTEAEIAERWSDKAAKD
ncbi:MAG: hypothetical protein ACRDGA_14320 [Bacteroidota bacterium]